MAEGIPPEAWSAALADPAVAALPTLHGFPRGRFQAAADWDTGERAIAEHLLYAVVRGRMRAGTGADERAATLSAGGMCFVPAGRAFRFRAERPAPVVERLRLVATRGSRPLVFGRTALVVTGDAACRRALDAVQAELARPERERAPAALRAAGALLLVALARAAAPAGPGLPPAALARCAALAEREPWCEPADLARAAGLSHDWFARAFRRATGVSPRRWLMQERVRRAAARLAAGGESVETVARACGWRDPKLFGRQFRAVLGAPPARWRRGAQPLA